mmetsp:Transcript_40291/g.45850  ORF Transcript_40291/g.45850 Transcript_40291/m.45850 type:complete len:80 (-) Transcript_40291:1502-1741(-)
MASSSTSTHASTYDSTKSTRVSVVAVRLAVLNRVCDRQDWFAFYFSYFVGHFGWTTDEAGKYPLELLLPILFFLQKFYL